MKPTILLLMSVMVMTAHCLSTFHFHHGDQLLRAMQERKGKTFVIMVAKDDTTDKTLAVTNARVADGLYHQVLFEEPKPGQDGKVQGEPTPREVVWARVNADDEARNSHLLQRLNVDKKSLETAPAVFIFKDGEGQQLHGPTTVRHTMRKVVELTKPAAAEAPKEEAPKTQ